MQCPSNPILSCPVLSYPIPAYQSYPAALSAHAIPSVSRPDTPQIQAGAGRRSGGRGGGEELRLLDDMVDDLDEGLADVLPRLGADLAEPGALGLGEGFAFLEGDGAAVGGYLV